MASYDIMDLAQSTLARCLFRAKALPYLILIWCEMDLYKQSNREKCIWKCRLQNGGHFCSILNVLHHEAF